LAKACGKGERCKYVFPLQVFVIGEDIFDRHTRTQEFEYDLNRIAQAADARFAVTNLGVYRYSVSKGKYVIHQEFYALSFMVSHSGYSRCSVGKGRKAVLTVQCLVGTLRYELVDRVSENAYFISQIPAC
jgi:hypothetical protein